MNCVNVIVLLSLQFVLLTMNTAYSYSGTISLYDNPKDVFGRLNLPKQPKHNVYHLPHQYLQYHPTNSIKQESGLYHHARHEIHHQHRQTTDSRDQKPHLKQDIVHHNHKKNVKLSRVTLATAPATDSIETITHHPLAFREAVHNKSNHQHHFEHTHIDEPTNFDVYTHTKSKSSSATSSHIHNTSKTAPTQSTSDSNVINISHPKRIHHNADAVRHLADSNSGSNVNDYFDNYYYNDDGDYKNDNDGDEYYVSQTPKSNISTTNNGSHRYDDDNRYISDHAYARVTREHHHSNHNHLEYDEDVGTSQDYMDDEPFKNSAEQFHEERTGVLTEQKFRELGTMEAVQQARDKYLQEQEQFRQRTPAEMAREHMNRMKIATKCHRPMPRIVQVSNETSKRYIPHCTILHRCGEDTGCCDTTRQVCTVKSYEDVEIYFFVIKVNAGTNVRDTDVLVLRNHTECHCVDRSSLTASLYMQRDKRSGFHSRQQIISTLVHNVIQDGHVVENNKSMEQHNKQTYDEYTADSNGMHINGSTSCLCAKHFDTFLSEMEPTGAFDCQCDCRSNNLPCQRLKNGEEGFAMDDRRCIAERMCKYPACAYGDYSLQAGRCPRLRNHKRTITRYNYDMV